MSDPQLFRFHDPSRGSDVVACIVNGQRHCRDLDERGETDLRDLRVAGSYLRHHDALLELADVSPASAEALRRAALVDFCLAIETLFPHLREELPV